MSKKQLRKKVAQKMKELGVPFKLYRGNKKVAWRFWNTYHLKTFLRTLHAATPGTLVHDCDGFNHISIGFEEHDGFPYLVNKKKVIVPWGGMISFSDGGIRCECSAPDLRPRTRQEIDEFFLNFLKSPWAQFEISTGSVEGLKYSRWYAKLSLGQSLTNELGILEDTL